MSGECCFGFVFFGHLDLIITREFIHKGEEHVASGIIDQVSICGNGKLSLGLARFKSL